MGFKAPPTGLPPDLKAGDIVTFETRQLPEGRFGITSISRASGTSK
jgi:hypothetical protein